MLQLDMKGKTMTTPNRKVAQDAARIENMMLRYQRQIGSVTARHTIHDVAYRTSLKTDEAKKAAAYMVDLGMIAANVDRGGVMYSLKGSAK